MIDIDYKSVLIDEPFEVYLAKKEEYLTSHELRTFVKCPREYYLRRIGALTADPTKASTELLIGSAAHKLILEGRQEFDKCYAVGAPINPKTGHEYGRETQAFAKWEEEQRREKGMNVEFLGTAQWYVVSSMADSVARHAEAQKLLHHGVAERVLRSDFGGIPVQSRLDWFTQIGEVPVIVDLKTCSDLDSFEYDAKRFLYGLQTSFYRYILLRSIFDEYDVDNAIPAKVFMIAVEKKAPFRCGVFEVSESTLGYFTEKILISIAALGNCQKTGEFPTLYESVRTLDLT